MKYRSFYELFTYISLQIQRVSTSNHLFNYISYNSCAGYMFILFCNSTYIIQKTGLVKISIKEAVGFSIFCEFVRVLIVNIEPLNVYFKWLGACQPRRPIFILFVLEPNLMNLSYFAKLPNASSNS